jgi:hypothetical protein
MAAQWGSHSLAARSTAGWYFTRPAADGFLPVLAVRPLTPSFTDPGGWGFLETFDSFSFPTKNQLGISTIWVQLSDDGSMLIYYMLVMNFSRSTIEYAFLESDL